MCSTKHANQLRNLEPDARSCSSRFIDIRSLLLTRCLHANLGGQHAERQHHEALAQFTHDTGARHRVVGRQAGGLRRQGDTVGQHLVRRPVSECAGPLAASHHRTLRRLHPAKARDEAEELLRDAHAARKGKGVDPAERKREERNAISFEQLAKEYMEKASAGVILGRKGKPKKSGTVTIDKYRITHLVGHFGSKLVKNIDRGDVSAASKS